MSSLAPTCRDPGGDGEEGGQRSQDGGQGHHDGARDACHSLSHVLRISRVIPGSHVCLTGPLCHMWGCVVARPSLNTDWRVEDTGPLRPGLRESPHSPGPALSSVQCPGAGLTTPAYTIAQCHSERSTPAQIVSTTSDNCQARGHF